MQAWAAVGVALVVAATGAVGSVTGPAGVGVGAGTAAHPSAASAAPALVPPRAPAQATASSASAAIDAARQPRFRHLGVDDGLPSSLVSSITQDRRGFMWIGTSHGVSRYDGHQFRTYGHRPGDPSGLPRDHVDQVYEDRGGTLWVVTADGVSQYVPARDGFVTHLGPDSDLPTGEPATERRVVRGVAEDGRGTLWVATSRGLYQLDRMTGRATAFALDVVAPGGRGRPARRPNLTAVYADRGGRVWVGSQQGLYRLDPTAAGAPTIRYYGHDPRDPHSLADTAIHALTQDVAGDVWVGTWSGGLARLDARTGRLTRYRHDARDPHSIALDQISCLGADRRGGVWVGTVNGGLDYFDPATGHFRHHRYDPNLPSGIGSNSVWTVYQDATNTLWVGTYSGGLDVSTLTGPAIRHFRAVPGDSASLSYNAVPAFAEGRNGRLWVGTDGGGLNLFDPATDRFTRYTPETTNLGSGAVVGVAEGRRGDVWVATWGGGLNQFDPVRRRFTAFTTRTSNMPSDNVYDVIEDRAGRLWVAMDAARVGLFDRARGRLAHAYDVAAPGAPVTATQFVRGLADGTIAAGLHDGGLTIIDPASGRLTYYSAAGTAARPGVHAVLGGDDVRALLEAEPGVVWVGTNNGLDRLQLATGAVTHYGEADGLPSRFVSGILPDGAGRLWVSTDRGVTRFDPATRAAKTFARADGLGGSEFLMRAALRARDGTLYFGGNHGVSALRPDRLVENTRPPPVVVTGLQLFNRPVPVGAPGSPLRRPADRTDTLVLTYDKNVVTFEFAALDYTAPEKNRYAYRLDGFDQDWQAVGTQTSASYTNLAPGRYTFRVRGSNGDGVWNLAGAAMALVITPPWWATWWFRLLEAAAAGAAVRALWRFQQRRRLEVELGQRALRDPLTGLANRALFRDRVEHALTRLTRAASAEAGEAARVAVLFLDLDGFKAVNDTFGHHAGDRLLQGVAARLLNATRGCDTVARLGGDEFAVLVENARGRADATTVAARIVDALRAPVPVAGGGPSGAAVREARVGVSVGVAFAEVGGDADTLLGHADVAMYQAKTSGKGRAAVYDPAVVTEAAERLALETDLAHAIAGGVLAPDCPTRGEFMLAYQPIVSLATGAVYGVEALLRWHHPEHGLVSPARFIPLAEASGLIVELGRWVLAEACREAAGWPAGPDAAVGVSVNVSGRQLGDPALPAHVADALAASGLPAAQLTLEITESVLMRDTDAALATLRTLKALGVRLAIDDFGTGYSSLRYLQQFPVDVLKIDKAFVDRVAHGGNDTALARTIVALGETLGLRTVAEGVEEPAQHAALRAVGCDLAQGYLFARPLDAVALRATLAPGATLPG